MEGCVISLEGFQIKNHVLNLVLPMNTYIPYIVPINLLFIGSTMQLLFQSFDQSDVFTSTMAF